MSEGMGTKEKAQELWHELLGQAKIGGLYSGECEWFEQRIEDALSAHERQVREERDYQYTEAFMGDGARGTGPMTPELARLTLKEMIGYAKEEQREECARKGGNMAYEITGSKFVANQVAQAIRQGGE